MKYIGDVRTESGVSLECYECECGFAIGIDSSYLEQVEGVRLQCPCCGKDMVIIYLEE